MSDGPTNDPGGPVFEVPWTVQMALREAGATDLPHDEQVDAIRTAVDAGWLPEPAVDVLIAGGYPELAD